MKSIIVPFFIPHHGCPHLCVFCNQVKIAGLTNGMPGEGEILDRIASYRDSARRSEVEVAFYGGTFTSLPLSIQKKLLYPLQPLIESGQVSGIRVSTRPDAIDASSAQFIRDMGVTTVELGVQSLDDEVLTLAGRGHTASCVDDACRTLRGVGFRLGIQLMTGLPGDAPEKSLGTLEHVLALQPDFLRIYPTLVISGTALENLYRNGSYQPSSLSSAVDLCKKMLHKSLTAAVPVIRIGLQQTEDLATPGVIVAGPYHPAFRQLVETELCFDLLCKLVGGFPPGDIVNVFCAPSRIADVAGHGKSNRARLQTTAGIRLGRIKADATLSRFELRAEVGGIMQNGHLLRDITYS